MEYCNIKKTFENLHRSCQYLFPSVSVFSAEPTTCSDSIKVHLARAMTWRTEVLGNYEKYRYQLFDLLDQVLMQYINSSDEDGIGAKDVQLLEKVRNTIVQDVLYQLYMSYKHIKNFDVLISSPQSSFITSTQVADDCVHRVIRYSKIECEDSMMHIEDQLDQLKFNMDAVTTLALTDM